MVLNETEIDNAISLKYKLKDTFISVNSITTIVKEHPGKFPFLSKQSIKTIKDRVTMYCNAKKWVQSTTKHTGMVFQRPKPSTRKKK